MKRIISTLIVLGIAAIMITSITSCAKEEEAGEIVLSFPTFWVGQDSKGEPIAQLVESFNAEHVDGIRVVIEENPDTDGYKDKINTQLGAGQAPDIFVFNPGPTEFGYYDSDILMDFTEELSGAWADDFVPGNIEFNTIDGRTKSVPYEIGVTPIWYNTELFAEAGISEFPKTIEEFWDACDALKAAGIVPTSQMTGGTNAWTSMLWYSHVVDSLGGPDVWSKPLSDPLFVEAAEVLLRMYQDGNTTRDAVGGDAGVSGGHYMAGDTAMFINGPWYIGRIKGDAPDTYAATRLAAAPQVGEYYGAQIGFNLSNLAAANTDDPARRAAVLEFMRYMTRPDNVQLVSEASGALFAIKYELGADAEPLQREFVRATSEASFMTGGFFTYYGVDVVLEFGQALEAMALGEATPEEFVQMLIDIAD